MYLYSVLKDSVDASNSEKVSLQGQHASDFVFIVLHRGKECLCSSLIWKV